MDYEELLKYSKKFEEIEGRDIFYKLATKLISKSDNMDDIIDAMFIILLTWNQAYYRYKPFDRKHYEELAGTIKNNMDIFNILKEKSLDDVNFDETENLIGKIYSKLLSILGPTGASKALHLMNKNLFMMWDDRIRKGYKTGTDERSYIIFMKEMQSIANEVIDSICRKFNCPRDSAIERLLKLINQKTLPKLIDEYNYVKFTKKVL